MICEKPFTLSLNEFQELKELALAKQLVLVEAITNQYLTNYQGIKDAISQIGELKVIECNYSQYSSRYDLFQQGTVLPAFNPKFGGGALMDINIYNIHFIVGLLGKPTSVRYLANIQRDIDTSGVLILEYPQTKVVCIGAKDSTAAIRSTIQGNQGSIIVHGPTNVVDRYELQLNQEASQVFDRKQHPHRMYEEFKQFQQVIETHDMAFVEARLNHSQIVMEVVALALQDAGIVLG